jgi:hypothetical protein
VVIISHRAEIYLIFNYEHSCQHAPRVPTLFYRYWYILVLKPWTTTSKLVSPNTRTQSRRLFITTNNSPARLTLAKEQTNDSQRFKASAQYSTASVLHRVEQRFAKSDLSQPHVASLLVLCPPTSHKLQEVWIPARRRPLLGSN